MAEKENTTEAVTEAKEQAAARRNHDETEQSMASTQKKAAEPAKKSNVNVIVATGKRKSAAARATIQEGKGVVRINKRLLALYTPEIARMKIEEPIVLSSPLTQKYDIDVEVRGGGVFGQADAARQAIARAIVKFSKDKQLKQKMVAYDRNLLIYDTRRAETRKPSRSSQGARRKRQLSKR